MSKLTKIQRRAIERAIYDADRALKYIMGDSVAVCRRMNANGGTTLDYRRADGLGLSEVTKEYGSDLCGLPDAVRNLRALIGE